MSDLAIRIEKLGKMYRIGRTQRRYDTLRDRIAGGLAFLLRRLLDAKFERYHPETIWALRDVFLEIKGGEVLGIIGRNGAGKSTLLKILSGVTEPTEGRIEIHGRIGSLLEVGTGFHPELTGRDNIYLNGAILGMKRNEIRKNFDEIVAFAEVEKFIDTPIKHYSSGMYLRLAFAVAAHLEPEILLVDEVLAVGDYAFQKKCLNEMGSLSRSGRTVLFVSHNMTAINTLCKRVILLKEGTVIKDGLASEVVPTYLNQGNIVTSQKVWSEKDRPGNSAFQLISVVLKNRRGEFAEEFNISESATIEVEYEVVKQGTRAMLSLVLFDANGYCVLSSLDNTEDNTYHGKPLERGRYLSACSFYADLLNNGQYHISIIGASDYWSDSFRADHVISFEAMEDGALKRDYWGSFGGVVRPRLSWTTKPIAAIDEE
jgi:lipopolysaccharide transport system ATP-binding protein